MLIYATKKLLMAFFAFVEARYCIMCLFRMNAAEGGRGWLHLKTRAEDANFLAGGSL